MAPDEEKQEGLKAKKKVAKTLLFNSEKIQAQAQAQAEADSSAQPAAASRLSPEAEALTERADDTAPKKRVAKTLIFDPSSAIEKAATQEAAMAAQAALEKKQKDKETMANVQDIVMAATLAQEKDKAEREQAANQQAGLEQPSGAPELIKEEIDVAPPVVAEPAIKPKRKVPRTMLYTPVPDLVNAALDETIAPGVAHPATDIAGHPPDPHSDLPIRRLSTKKIAKTLVFDAAAFNQSDSLNTIDAAPEAVGGLPVTTTPASTPVRQKRAQQYVAKTMLDHSILFDQVSKVQHKAEEKAIEVAREKANEPFKPFFQVEAKKKTLPCSWSWDTTYASERYKYCGNCQHAVYNLQGLEKADADELVFKAENLKKYTLYQRPDGLFMTSNCPVAVKRRSDTVLISVGAVLAVACLLVYMANLPKPKPQPVEASQDAGPVKFVRTASKDAKGRTVYTTTAVKGSSHSSSRLQPAGVKLQPGASHWDEATQKFVVDVPLEKPAPPPVTNTASQSDADTDWEFSSPQK